MELTDMKERIESGIDSELKAYCLIGVPHMAEQVMPVVESFWKATRIIRPAINIERIVRVVFGVSPITINAGAHKLSIELSDNSVAACIHGIVVLDCTRLLKYGQRHQIAIILEELVHAYMNVKDELLASEIVAKLYDGVEFRNGQYFQIQERA